MSDLGQQSNANPSDFAGQFNAIQFMIKQVLGRANFATLVKVVSCTNSGGVSPFGFVDVQPMLNVLDGSGKVVKGGQNKIYQLPYARIQGGASAIILDPVIGDIGIAIFADRDISVVKATQKVGNAGSTRRNSASDGLYVGGVLNAAPTQYVQFNSSGITVKSPNAVTVIAPAINLEKDGTALQTLLNSTLLTWLNAHTHTSAASGSPTSAPLTTPPTTVATTTTKAE